MNLVNADGLGIDLSAWYIPRMLVEELPLIRGISGFSETPFDAYSEVGPLVVKGFPAERDGLTVQRCMCLCGNAGCGDEADVDVRFLHNPDNFKAGTCPLKTKASLPPFDVLLAVCRERRMRSAEDYVSALVRGYLPAGAPSDPTNYDQWTSWSDFLSNPGYFSNQELFDGLLALDLDNLGLLPRPDRRRVLLFSKYWASIKGKALELGIKEAEIPDHLAEIVECLRPMGDFFDRSSRSEGSRSSSTSGSGVIEVGTQDDQKSASESAESALHLSSPNSVLINSVTIWLPTGAEMQRELINGFFHNVWETLDREDTLGRNGLALVEETILKPLEPVKPELVEEFYRQYAGVKKHKIRGRNWMQAYSLWFSESHMRFINWSSAGLGKTRTIPAIVSEYDIFLTVLFSPKTISNEHNPQLAEELVIEDPLAVLHYSDNSMGKEAMKPLELEPGKHHYFIINPEKLQLGKKSHAIVEYLMSLKPGLIVFDEGHLLVSIGLIEPETGETAKDPAYRPRMDGLRCLLDKLDAMQRVIVLTGTPVRVDSREGRALFELIGVDIGEITKDMSEMNALRLRGRLQEYGFLFLNHRLPEFRRFIYPFLVEPQTAAKLNDRGSMAEKEAVRIRIALDHIFNLKGKVVVNAENVKLPESDALPVKDFDEDQKAKKAQPILGSRFPLVRLNYEPLERAVNPVYYTYFIDGPVEAITECLMERGERFRLCTGDSEEADLGEYLTERDSSLIASSAWSTGVDGSQKVSNTIVTLGLCWHDSGHRQMVARVHRQGACTPDGTPSNVIHEIIPVALNVEYDVRRLNKVYSRRGFAEVLRLGEIEEDGEQDLELAVKAIDELQKQAVLPGIELSQLGEGEQ